MISKENILVKLKELKPLFEQHELKLLGLFGSYSTGRENAESDIDILIETTPAFLDKYKGFKAHLKLDELKTLLENIFDKKIDFTDRQGLIQHNNLYILDKAIYV